MITALLAGLKIQPSELTALQETFANLDTDKDGFLSANELRENLYGVFSSQFEQGTPKQLDEREQQRRKELVDAIIRKCDLNKDGFIDFQEFLQAAVDYNTILNKENITIAFSMFDLNNDGKISTDEIKRVLNASPARPATAKKSHAINLTPSTLN